MDEVDRWMTAAGIPLEDNVEPGASQVKSGGGKKIARNSKSFGVGFAGDEVALTEKSSPVVLESLVALENAMKKKKKVEISSERTKLNSDLIDEGRSSVGMKMQKKK